MQENYINLPRSNSSGNPSVSSVITGLLRQKHPFCLNCWILSARLLSCLCPVMPVTHIQDVQRVSFPREKPRGWCLSLDSWRAMERVWVALCLLGPSSWFWKAQMSATLHLKLHSRWSSQLSPFFTHMWPGVWCFPNQYERDESAGESLFFFFNSLLNRMGKWYKMRERESCDMRLSLKCHSMSP